MDFYLVRKSSAKMDRLWTSGSARWPWPSSLARRSTNSKSPNFATRRNLAVRKIPLTLPEWSRRMFFVATCRSQGLFSFAPAFHVTRYFLDGREAGLDGIGGGQRAAQQPAHAEAVHRQCFLHAFLQAVCRAGVDAFQLPKDLLQLRFRRRVIGHRVGVADSPVIIALSVFRQMLGHVAPLVNLAALYFGALAEHALDASAQRFRPVDHEQVAPLGIKTTRHQVLRQLLDHRGVFRRSLPQPQYMLFPAGFNAQRHHQHLLAEMNPVDQNRHQIQIAEFFLAQFLQLRCTGLHEFAAHAGFLNPVAIDYTLHRPSIISRGQSRDDPFTHRALPPSVVLQPRITV